MSDTDDTNTDDLPAGIRELRKVHPGADVWPDPEPEPNKQPEPDTKDPA